MKKLGRPRTGNAMVMIGVRLLPEVWHSLEIEASQKGLESAGILARGILTDHAKKKR